jgi:two-component system NtrC family sensor kinase
MKNKIFLIISFLFIQVVYAQRNEIDSLMNIINKQRKDTNEVIAKINLVGFYLFTNPDSAIITGRQAVDLARTLNYSKGEGNALNLLGECLHLVGDFPKALESLFNALRISREIKDPDMESTSLDFIGIAYVDLGEYRQGLNYLYQAKEINDKSPLNSNKMMGAFRLSNIGHAYEKLNMPDSALFFQQQAQILSHALSHDSPPGPETALILTRLGVIQSDLGNQTQALSHYTDAIHIGDVLNLGSAQFRIAELFYRLNQPDSSLYYARLAFINNQRSSEKTWLLETSNLLVKLYKTKNKIDSAFHYQEVSIALKDSLFGPEKFHRLQLLAINEQQRQQEIIQRQKEIQHEKEKFESDIKMVALLVIVGFFLLLAIILYRNNRQKQYTNVLLQQQKEKVESTLSELKSTQSQLIQQEKMASLGELTAGIAHEIQNPLNFVNNFSEINNELIEELKAERSKLNAEEQDELLNDISKNNEKINHHGKRADSIVKGMLEHSRTSTGKKEPTDINKLADEYLRLSYHGLRAKDKSFNTEIKMDLDESIGKINVVPQDIGRVLLNLFNNAFYAVNEKKRTADENYKPEVIVTTKCSSPSPLERGRGEVIITVKDNGNGIPQNIVEKIFQPFFTTKPTGQGTGLGLSLAYDIVKAHGGEIKVEGNDSEGTIFIIQLPIN